MKKKMKNGLGDISGKKEEFINIEYFFFIYCLDALCILYSI